MASRPSAVEVSVEARDFVELFGKTSKVDAKLRTALRRNICNAAKDAATDVQSEVLKPPLRSAGRTRQKGLRRAIASGVKVQVATGATSKRVGVYIRATSRGLGEGSRRRLVRRWDRGEFRHPVFGTDVWVTQAGRPYFGSVIRKRKADIAAAVAAAMDEAKSSLN